MKLKPIVVGLAALTAGFVGPAFANGHTAPSAQYMSTQKHLASMDSRIANMEKALNQNSAGHFGVPGSWMNRITLSGEINVDATWSNKTPSADIADTIDGIHVADGGRYHGGHSTDIGLSDANLYVDAAVNDWTKAHIALDFQDGRRVSSSYNHAHSNEPENFSVDEAYATFGNFAHSPWYFQLGREYVPFGQYERHPITETLPQALEMTRATAAQIGFIDASGFNVAAYGFRNNGFINPNTGRRNIQSWGAHAGYVGDFGHDTGLFAGVDWISDMGASVAINQSLLSNDTVNGIAADLGGHYSMFDAAVHYVTALEGFDADKLPHNINGSKTEPSAIAADVGFTFDLFGQRNRLGFGYQHSSEASGVITNHDAVSVPPNGSNIYFGTGLPQTRYQADYTFNVNKNVDATIEVVHDKDYSQANLGTGKNSTTGILRVAVKLA